MTNCIHIFVTELWDISFTHFKQHEKIILIRVCPSRSEMADILLGQGQLDSLDTGTNNLMKVQTKFFYELGPGGI